MHPAAKKAKRHLDKARKLTAKYPSPLAGMTMDQAINHIRKTREKLWEEKLAVSSGHK